MMVKLFGTGGEVRMGGWPTGIATNPLQTVMWITVLLAQLGWIGVNVIPIMIFGVLLGFVLWWMSWTGK